MASWVTQLSGLVRSSATVWLKPGLLICLKFAGNCGGRTSLSAFIVCASINTTYYTLIVKKIEVQAAVLTTYGYDYGSVFQKPRLATDCFFKQRYRR